MLIHDHLPYLNQVNALNQARTDRYQSLYWEKTHLGWVRNDRILFLQCFPDLFIIDPTHNAIHFSHSFIDATLDERHRRIHRFCTFLYQYGAVKTWRNEKYTIYHHIVERKKPLFDIERACVPFLGLPAYGVHINGLSRDQMWIAKRSQTRMVDPGKFDQIVAGGLPSGLSLWENICKECQEEANIHSSLLSTLTTGHFLHYCAEDTRGIRSDYLYCFDLNLPTTFSPSVYDDEVESFVLMPLSDIAQLITQVGYFKDNSAIVILDYLIRHQHLPSFPAYEALILNIPFELDSSE